MNEPITARHLLERKKATGGPQKRGTMTWMSPAAIGQGRVSPGLLAAVGGSPLGIA